MSYPQPTAAQATVAGQTVYRLKTPLSSPGDIYEIDAGCQALCLGPESDLQLVKAAYYDPTTPQTGVQSVIISPDRSFISRLDARLDQPYPSSGGKLGRILLSPQDLYDPSYVPAGADPDFDVIYYWRPKLDILAYFQAPSVLAVQRNDRTYRWVAIPAPAVGAGNEVWMMIPYWGRAYAHVDIFNIAPHAVTVELRGINFSTDLGTAEETVLSAAAVVAPLGKRRIIVRASVDGMYDMLGLRYLLTTAETDTTQMTRILTSDDAQ